MRIIADGFGGDNAPLSVLKGCELAVKELGVDITVTGKKEALEKCIADNGIDKTGIEIVDAEDVITMSDEPTSILRAKRKSSMGVALDLLAQGGGDAIVSAGNTGALLSGSTLIVKRIRGIKRAALGAVLPSESGFVMLMDSGATIDCKPEFLEQFGVMGSIYMKKMFGIESPRVGLANNGTEDCKGTELYIEANKLLHENGNINFIGNVEGRGLMTGETDVMVVDGFTGNLMLKSCEGAAKYFSNAIKGFFAGFGKLAGLMVYSKIKAFRKRADYKEVGGAPFIGIEKPVVKAHGSSDAKAFKNAVRQAVQFAQAGIVDEIKRAITKDGSDTNA